MPKLTQRNLIWGMTVVIVALAGLLFVSFTNRPGTDRPEANHLVNIAPSGLTFPAAWKEAKKISLAHKQNNVISEATRENPDAVMVIREVPTELAKDFDLSKLPDQVVASLQTEIDGFTLINKGFTKIGSHDAAKINYSISTDDLKIQSINAMFIIPTATKSFYVTYQTPGDMTKLDNDITTINKSIGTYLESRLK